MSRKNTKRQSAEYYQEQAAIKARKKHRKQTILFVILAVMVLAVALPLILLYGVNVTHYATIEIENYGTVRLELYGNKAPQTVDRFIFLSEKGFYNGLTFHRIIDGTLIQGGCPFGDGTGGYINGLYGEFSDNGYPSNDLTHRRGAIAFSHSASAQNGLSAYNTGSSQFFIMQKDVPSYNGKYAVFGYVTEGMDIVDAIAANTPLLPESSDDAEAEVATGSCNVAKADQPVITSITIKGAGLRGLWDRVCDLFG